MTRNILLRTFLIAAATAVAPVTSRAATFYWDGNNNNTALSSSDNTTTGALNWLSGGYWDNGTTSATLASWTAGDSAIFGGSAASETITAGTFTIGNLTFGSGALGAGTSGTAYTITGGTLTLSSTTITTNTDTSISSVLAGSSTLTKAGAGTLTLSAANTYTGVTTVSAGTINLNFSAAGAPTSNILSTSSGLTLAGGTLQLTGKASTTNSQTVRGLVLNAGASAITLTANATSNPLLLSVGGITRNVGSTLNITQPTGTISASNGLVTTSGNTSGILGGWATVGGTDWAVAGSGSGVTAYSGYTNNTWAAGNNTTVTASSSPTSGSTTNSLRFNNAGAYTVTLAGTNTVTSGGILVTSNVGSNLSTITGGTLQGASGKDLVVIQNNTSNGLTISSVIADNTSATGLTKSGAGTLTLSSAASTFTGDITISSGLIDVLGTGASNGSSTSLGNMVAASSRSITVKPGATLRFSGSDAVGTYNLNANANVSLIAEGTGIITRSTTGGTAGTFNSIGNVILRNGGKIVTTNGNAALDNTKTGSGNVGAFAFNGTVTVDGAASPGAGATISPLSGQTTNNFINLGTASAQALGGDRVLCQRFDRLGLSRPHCV